MNCEQVREQLSAYFDGELVGGDVRHNEVREHVAGCDMCADQLRSYEQLRGLVSAQPDSKICPPSWESIATRLDSEGGMSLVTGASKLDSVPAAIAVGSRASAVRVIPIIRSRRIAIAGLLTLAASALLFVSLRNAKQHEVSPTKQADIATINLQPLMELFNTDAEKALATLATHNPTEDVTLAEAEAEFGRPTFVQASARTNSLPGNAHLVSTKLMQFPYCKCPKGACTCGPGGCNCVACLCERPDGSTYIVLEQCKSQSVTFGDLSVQLVKRGDRHLQQVETQGTTAISWEQDGERLTAIGVRGSDEIDLLLARN